jgi:DNA polymerase III subunit delta'
MPFRANRAVELVRQSHEMGRLGHAYLITGPREAALEEVANRIIGTVSGEGSRNELDEWIGHGATLLRPNSKSRRISIGDDSDEVGTMRWFLRKMNMSVEVGAHRYGVIVDAERMTVQTQNAFLKTLEEPPKQTLLLLLTSKPEELLTTILSRVIELQILPEPGARRYSAQEQELLTLLEQHGKRGQYSVSSALALKAGFDAVVAGLRDSVEKELEADFKREKEMFGKTTDGSYLKIREDQVEALIESSYMQQRDALLELMVAWWGDIVRQKTGTTHLDLPEYAGATSALAEKMELPDLLNRVKALRKLEQNLHTNVNAALALEVGFLDAFA